MDLVTVLGRLMRLAEQDLSRACAVVDVLVAVHGPQPVADALHMIAGSELADLGWSVPRSGTAV